MTKIVPFFILLFVACSTPKPLILKTSFHTIYRSAYGGSERSGYLHITNNEDFIKLIDNLKIDASEFNSLVTIDFKENDVLVLNQGQKSSGGYSIEVASMDLQNKVLLVKKFEKIPGKGEIVTMALSAPYCITIIPKAKEIKISE